MDSRIHDIKEVATGGPVPWLPGIPHRIAADRGLGPYLAARSNLVTQLADQVRLNTAGEAPAWAIQPYTPLSAEVIAELQVWRAATQVDPSDLRLTGAPQLGHATQSLATASRKATRHGHLRRPAMAATSCHRSPQHHGGPLYAGPCRKVEQPDPGRLRCHPARAVGGRRGYPTRRPPRSSPLVAHPRSATGNANQEPATPAAVPATRRTTTTSHDKQPPLPRSAPPPAFGPSR